MPVDQIGIALITPANSLIRSNASLEDWIFTLQENLASWLPKPSSTRVLANLLAVTKENKSIELSVICVPNPYLSVVNRSRRIIAGQEHQTAEPITPLKIYPSG